MQLTIDNHWQTTATNGFDHAENKDITKFAEFITNFPNTEHMTATMTATQQGEHVDVILTCCGKQTMWELKSYDNFHPEKPIKYYWLKLNKYKLIQQSIEKYNPHATYYCMFAGTTDYAYYIDFERIKANIENSRYDVYPEHNRATTAGPDDKYQWEMMIHIPLCDMKKIKYKNL